MPFSGPNDKKIPDNVRREREELRRQWVAIWNRSFNQAVKLGLSEKEAEAEAFRLANGALAKRKEGERSPGVKVMSQGVRAVEFDDGVKVWSGVEKGE